MGFSPIREALTRTSNRLVIVWILLEAKYVKTFENSSSEPYKYGSNLYSIIRSSVLGASIF